MHVSRRCSGGTFRRISIAMSLIIFLALYVIYFRGMISSRKKQTTVISESSFRRYFAKSHYSRAFQRQLPQLDTIEWPKIEFSSTPIGSNGSYHELFGPKYSAGQYRVQENIFSYFIKFMDKHGLSNRWFLYAGSLLGSFRHHGIVPWDDDIDILVDKQCEDFIWKELNNSKNDYLLARAGKRDKLYAKLILPANTSQDSEGSRQLFNYPWGWPSIDLHYFVQNHTHIEVTAMEGPRYVSFRIADVFPLILRPFNKLWVPTPRNTFKFIKEEIYNISECAESSYSHAFEKVVKSNSIECDKLSERYFFVRRFLPRQGNSKSGEEDDLDWMLEKLIRKINRTHSEVIHEILLVAPRHEASVNIYSMKLETNV